VPPYTAPTKAPATTQKKLANGLIIAAEETPVRCFAAEQAQPALPALPARGAGPRASLALRAGVRLALASPWPERTHAQQRTHTGGGLP
jgi:hypothetical protein